MVQSETSRDGIESIPVPTQHPLGEFLNEIEDGYYETDLRGNFVFINDAMCRIVGYSREQLTDSLTRRYSTYIDSSTAEILYRVFSQVYRTGNPVKSLAFPLKGKDDVVRHLDISVSLIREASGEAVGFRGFVRDMTDSRMLEEALRTRVNMLSLLQQVDTELNYHLNPEAVLMLGMNAAMTISDADAGFIGLVEGGRLRIVRAVGVTDQRDLDLSEGIVGRAVRLQRPELVLDVDQDSDYIADVPGIQAEIAVPLVARDRLIAVLNLETRDAARFTSEIYEFVLLLTTRLAAALDNALLLQTSQEQLAALQKLYSQVSDLEHFKTDMIRIAAHDMRSPLAVIGTYVDLLQTDLEPYLDPAHRGYFDAIGQALDRMIKLSTDVLSLERIQERQDAIKETFQLDDLVREVAGGYRGEARHNSIDFRIITPPQSVYAVGDALELGEAIDNLISNALKYTPQGGRVVVTLSESTNRVCFEVEDTGLGIAEADQSRLFEPFYRVKTHETGVISGTGLGLHLVKKVIERHGGTVCFHSEPGVGSCFGFELPVSVQSAAAPVKSHSRHRKQRVGA